MELKLDTKILFTEQYTSTGIGDNEVREGNVLQFSPSKKYVYIEQYRYATNDFIKRWYDVNLVTVLEILDK